ncbi:MAG: ROK family protein [Lentisphaerae bacterium]|nr:ROK family protein [Lentisphaerota bacterium]
MKTDASWFLETPGIVPPLDRTFRPAALANRRFETEVRESNRGVHLIIALEADGGSVSRYETQVFPPDHERQAANKVYAERLLKFLLWQRGGWRVILAGPRELGETLTATYAKGGARAFDAGMMSEFYGQPFRIELTTPDRVPAARNNAKPLGRHLEGCRIGFDLGASDRKVSAVLEGKTVFSEEVVWDPKSHADPRYHFDEIMSALKTAAAHLPRVDAIGGSSAGVFFGNQVRVASLFRGVPRELFEQRVRPLFLEIQKAWGGIPLDVINDGEVTALAGSMSMGVNRVLGIAMGSSLAGGYVDGDGKIPGWLDELAFAPVDYRPDAPEDEWSGDRGCGGQYFSQMAVNRLAGPAGIPLDGKKGLPERLKDVQALMAKGDERAHRIYETIGVYFGYAVAQFAAFYDMEFLLVLGRVTSGEGGDVVIRTAGRVLKQEFPDLSGKIKLVVPDESNRRVGQSIAAASLPRLR